MKKLFLQAIIGIFITIFAIFGVNAQSVSIWNGTYEIWTHGSGFENEPYLIENAQQLACLSELVNGGASAFENVYFKLTTDILIDSVTPWQPIGDENHFFSGHFDGGNHNVTLYIRTTSMKYVGLFGHVSHHSSFKNLGVDGEIVVNYGRNDALFVGGVIGYVRPNDPNTIFRIRNCSNKANITVVNGLFGTHINHVYAVGGLIGGSTYDGMFAPSNRGSGEIVGCQNTGHISVNAFSNGFLYNLTGGIIGAWTLGAQTSNQNAYLKINNCNNTGSISASWGGMTYVGGIIGETFVTSDQTITLNCCYNIGSVSAYTENNESYATCAGGIGGRLGGQVLNCYNAGSLDGSSIINKGGVTGWGGSVYNSYYLDSCGHNTQTGGIAKTEAQMKSSSFPVILNTANADSVLFIQDLLPFLNQGYPILGKISTQDPDSIGSTSAILCGKYTMPYIVDTCGFEYVCVSDSDSLPPIIVSFVDTSANVSAQIDGLQSGATYWYHFFVKKGGITYHGLGKEFTTSPCNLGMEITGDSNNLCQGDTTILFASIIDSLPTTCQYIWSNGSTDNNISVSQSGIYTVTATNMEGCSVTAQVNVAINPLPEINISGNTTYCMGNSTTLTASGADSYLWNNGSTNASLNVNIFGIYTVTGTSTAGCSNTASVTVLASQSPQITITGVTDICAGGSTTLTANGGTAYLWSNGVTDATLIVSSTGTYQVIGYDEAGCNAMASVIVNVWQPVTSEFTVECPDSCYVWNGQSYCTSGDYTQSLQTVHGCDSVVTLHLTITVGIDDHEVAGSMTVYPNPTSNILNVQCTMNNVQVGTMEILVYDAFGRLLRTTDCVGANNHSPLQTDTHGSSAQTQIDLSCFSSGVYFVKAVADGNVVAVRKVVKQ